MNTRKQINSGIFLAVLVLSAGLGIAAKYDEEDAIREFGIKEGRPITNGFVFIDGKYINPPYVVSTRGTGIFINGHLIERPCPWPIPKKINPQIPTEDPKLPKSITSNTTKYNKELQKYIGMKKAYYFDKYPKEEALKLLAQAYVDLPCITSAKLSADPEILDVTWVNGETSHIRLVLHLRKPPEWTRESILNHLEETKANYEDRLSKGDYYFLGSAHGRMTGTADGARMVLSALLPILKTSKDSKEVQQRMTQAGFPFFDERASEAFFANREIPRELENRVEALGKPDLGRETFQSSTNETSQISR